MVSQLIFECSLFLTCHLSRLFSVFTCLFTSRDVSFSRIFVSPVVFQHVFLNSNTESFNRFNGFNEPDRGMVLTLIVNKNNQNDSTGDDSQLDNWPAYPGRLDEHHRARAAVSFFATPRKPREGPHRQHGGSSGQAGSSSGRQAGSSGFLRHDGVTDDPLI